MCPDNDTSMGRLAAYTMGLFIIGLALHSASTAAIQLSIKKLGIQGFGELCIDAFEQLVDADSELCCMLDTLRDGGTLDGSLLDRVATLAARAVIDSANLVRVGGSA